MERKLKDYFPSLHLTFSEKKFIQESIEILEIFKPDITDEIERFLMEIKKMDKDKFTKGKIFFDYIFSLRYPVLSVKIQELKKLKGKIKEKGIKLDIPENMEIESFNLDVEDPEINDAIIKINEILSSEIWKQKNVLKNTSMEKM